MMLEQLCINSLAFFILFAWYLAVRWIVNKAWPLVIEIITEVFHLKKSH